MRSPRPLLGERDVVDDGLGMCLLVPDTNMKRYLQKGIRQFHVKYLNRGLPQNVAIYLHSLETGNYEDFRLCVDSFRERGYVFVAPDEFIASSGARPEKKAFL